MKYVCPECGRTGEPGTCEADGATRAPAGSDTLLGTMIQSWRVARLLGAGGMGRVYVAVHPDIGATVAIKVLKRDAAGDPDVVERFFNEARAVNVIKHEAIVDVIDLGKLADGSPFIVMEHLDGASLANILRRDRKPALGTTGRIVGEVLAALEAAHAKGVIHRDLKPDNIFISPSGRVTVLDFGIAKLLQSESALSTQTGSLLGTPAYMSPEQARSQPADARADLYSVGVILYEATTGALPFQAANVFDLLHMHVATAPEAPRSKNPEIPAALEAVILRALEKTPEKRFASAADMRRALAEATADLPPLALPSFVFAPAAPSTKQPSDPLAATAADTRDAAPTPESLARGETVPSHPPAPAPVAAPTVQISRRLLFALIGGAALIGLGGAVIGVLATRHDEPAKVASTAPPIAAVLIDAAVAKPVEVTAVIDAAVTPGPALDASVPPSKRPGRTVAAAQREPESTAPSSPPAAPSAPADSPGFKKLAIANPKAFDPKAYFATAEREARAMAGGEVVAGRYIWGGVSKAGTIDLTKHSAVYDFIIIDALRTNSAECIVTVQIYAGDPGPYVARASLDAAEKCRSLPRMAPPTCSVSQMWDKAVALGMEPATQTVTMARNTARKWQVSQREPDGPFSELIPDDCP